MSSIDPRNIRSYVAGDRVALLKAPMASFAIFDPTTPACRMAPPSGIKVPLLFPIYHSTSPLLAAYVTAKKIQLSDPPCGSTVIRPLAVYAMDQSGQLSTPSRRRPLLSMTRSTPSPPLFIHETILLPPLPATLDFAFTHPVIVNADKFFNSAIGVALSTK